jgi:hypothetical protein
MLGLSSQFLSLNFQKSSLKILDKGFNMLSFIALSNQNLNFNNLFKLGYSFLQFVD